MCGGSGPHQSRRRLGGRSLFGGLRGHRELVIRAPAESTGPTNTRQNKARLPCNTHTHTHICSITADARRCQCKNLFPILKESLRDCLSVCRVNWHSESLVNTVPPIHKNLARGSGRNEPFPYWDVNIVCKHDFTRAGKNDCVYSQPLFDRSICHRKDHILTHA